MIDRQLFGCSDYKSELEHSEWTGGVKEEELLP